MSCDITLRPQLCLQFRISFLSSWIRPCRTSSVDLVKMRAIIDGFMHIMHCSVGLDICVLAEQRLGSLRISRQILTSKRKPIFIIIRWRLRGMQRGRGLFSYRAVLACALRRRCSEERESSAIGRPAMTSEAVNKNAGRIQMSWKGNNLQRIWLNSLLSTSLHSSPYSPRKWGLYLETDTIGT